MNLPMRILISSLPLWAIAAGCTQTAEVEEAKKASVPVDPVVRAGEAMRVAAMLLAARAAALADGDGLRLGRVRVGVAAHAVCSLRARGGASLLGWLPALEQLFWLAGGGDRLTAPGERG